MEPVKFLKAYAPYKVGDVAGFEPEKAEKLVADGIATKDLGVEPPKEEEEKKDEEPVEETPATDEAGDENKENKDAK